MALAVQIAKCEGLTVHAVVDYPTKTVQLTFKGQMTETMDLTEVWAYVSKLGTDVKVVSVELRDISRINSSALISWLAFIKKIQARMSLKVSYACGAFIQQASMAIPVFGQPAVLVEEFEAPYFCEACNSAKVKSLKPAAIVKAEKISLPELKCEECEGILSFDELEAEYFLFLKYASKNKKA
jgi:ABC-type transporter Mla MlaB component